MKKFSGGKITASHSAAVDAAKPLVKKLQRSPLVKKISLGIIKPGLKTAPHRVKIKPTKSGLELTVRGTKAVQTIYVYTGSSDLVEKLIKDNF